MSSLFPSPSAHAAGADMSQNSAPQRPEGSPLLDRGSNASPSSMTQYHNHGPPLPPHLGGDYSLSTPPNEHLPPQSDDQPHLSREHASAAMKMRERNKRQQGILPNVRRQKPTSRYHTDFVQKDGKSSKNSDSSRPVSNGIKWASVNGDQSSHADAEESSDDASAFSSGPESEIEKEFKDQFGSRSRSVSRQTRAQSMTDTAPHHQQHQQLQLNPSMPLIIQQEAPHVNGQTQNDFDVFAAQSRGKQIAPRQAPLSFGASDDGRLPPPDHRATSRNKRAREIEDSNLDSQSSSAFAKRRKQPSEQAKHSTNLSSVAEGYGPPFNPTMASFNQPPMPSILPQPPMTPQDAELEDMFMQFRERFRNMQAGIEEDFRLAKDAHQAATGRANARARHAEIHRDEMDQKHAAQAKEKDIVQRIERESMDKQLMVERAENQALREELAKFREKTAAADEALEYERRTKMGGSATLEEHQALGSNEAALAKNHIAANQDFGNVNGMSAGKAKELESECKELHEKLRQIQVQQDQVKFTIEDLESKDLEDLTHKHIKKHIASIKDNQEKGSQLIMECEKFLDGSKHLTVKNTISNGSGPDEHARRW
ncbi:MAG: hypothetical protein Q9202_002496 [Teloschistes flavicans]